MNSLLETWFSSGPIVTDGAWGTQLQALGLQPGDSPDIWNLEYPDRVESVARAYVEAGSQIVLTNTFGANRITLDKYGLSDRASDINRAGTRLSRQAAQQSAKVFASIGPSGKLLLMGQVTESELESAFREQAMALAEGGADGIVVETMSDLTEAVIAVRTAKETGLPVVGCMVFDTGKNKDRTMMGITPEDAARGLTEAGADAVGSNCGQGIEGFLAICARLKASTDRPVWIKANAGMPEMIDGRIHYRTAPEEFASFVQG